MSPTRALIDRLPCPLVFLAGPLYLLPLVQSAITVILSLTVHRLAGPRRSWCALAGIPTRRVVTES